MMVNNDSSSLVGGKQNHGPWMMTFQKQIGNGKIGPQLHRHQTGIGLWEDGDLPMSVDVGEGNSRVVNVFWMFLSIMRYI